MLTASEATDHVAANNPTVAGEQCAQEASAPSISLRLVGRIEHRQLLKLTSSAAMLYRLA